MTSIVRRSRCETTSNRRRWLPVPTWPRPRRTWRAQAVLWGDHAPVGASGMSSVARSGTGARCRWQKAQMTGVAVLSRETGVVPFGRPKRLRNRISLPSSACGRSFRHQSKLSDA
jgi:hypothetical protein